MSYAAAAALQRAIWEVLVAAPALAGVAVHDALPSAAPGTFVLVGAETVRDASDGSGPGAEHWLTVSVISDAAGFLQAKSIAGAISDVLCGAALTLTRGRLVSLDFLRAEARRKEAGAVRRIDLTFRARIEL